jgi:hypothetical protein
MQSWVHIAEVASKNGYPVGNKFKEIARAFGVTTRFGGTDSKVVRRQSIAPRAIPLHSGSLPPLIRPSES